MAKHIAIGSLDSLEEEPLSEKKELNFIQAALIFVAACDVVILLAVLAFWWIVAKDWPPEFVWSTLKVLFASEPIATAAIQVFKIVKEGKQ